MKTCKTCDKQYVNRPGNYDSVKCDACLSNSCHSCRRVFDAEEIKHTHRCNPCERVHLQRNYEWSVKECARIESLLLAAQEERDQELEYLSEFVLDYPILVFWVEKHDRIEIRWDTSPTEGNTEKFFEGHEGKSLETRSNELREKFPDEKLPF